MLWFDFVVYFWFSFFLFEIQFLYLVNGMDEGVFILIFQIVQKVYFWGEEVGRGLGDFRCFFSYERQSWGRRLFVGVVRVLKEGSFDSEDKVLIFR